MGCQGSTFTFLMVAILQATLPASKEHRWTFVRTDVEGLDEIRGLTEAGKWEFEEVLTKELERAEKGKHRIRQRLYKSKNPVFALNSIQKGILQMCVSNGHSAVKHVEAISVQGPFVPFEGVWEWRRGLKALLADTLGKLKKAIPELQEGLLGQVFPILCEHNPELVRDRWRTVMMLSQLLHEGTKNTMSMSFAMAAKEHKQPKAFGLVCLVVCPRAKAIWRKIRSWWNLATHVSFPSFDVLDISMNKVVDLGCSRLNKVIQGVFQCGLWAIWKWRNKLDHASSNDRARVLQEDIFLSIQRLSKIWILARCKITGCNWSCWISNLRSLLASSL
ncbi:hypothetical protein Tco_0581120 [Tanacetum coccineum]